MLDAAGRGDHDVAREVALAMEGRQLLVRARAHDLRPSERRAPERVAGEDRLAEHVEDQLLGIVLVHRDLLEHHLALLGEPLHRRRGDHLRHHVEGALEMLVEHARVERGHLLAGAGVQLGAHRVEDLVDLLGAVAIGAAEQHVLEQVREALGARAGADPEPDRHRANGGHALSGDAHATGQFSDDVRALHR